MKPCSSFERSWVEHSQKNFTRLKDSIFNPARCRFFNSIDLLMIRFEIVNWAAIENVSTSPITSDLMRRKVDFDEFPQQRDPVDWGEKESVLKNS